VVVVLLLVAGAAWAIVLRAVTVGFGMGDAPTYLAMAEDPWTLQPPPWGYRVAVPYLAAGLSHVFDLTIPAAFMLIQVASFSAILVILGAYLKAHTSLGAMSLVVLAILFSLSFPGVYNLHNPVHVGYVEHLLILLGVVAIHHDRYRWLLAVVIVGSLVKETIGALLIVTYLFCAWSNESPGRLALKLMPLAAGYLAIFLWLRMGGPFNGDNGLGEYLQAYNGHSQRVYQYWGGVHGAGLRAAFSFGVIWIMSCFGFLYSDKTVRRLCILIPLAFAQIFLATDVQRMVGVAFPAVLLLTASLYERIEVRWQLLLAAIHSIFFVSMNRFFGDFQTVLRCLLVLGAIAAGICLLRMRHLLVGRPHAVESTT